MEQKLIKTHTLENGLELEIYDACRQVAADRWLVKMVARVNVPVRRALSGSPLEGPAEAGDIASALGETVTFEQARERNFVDDAGKEALFRELCDAYADSSRRYLGHAEFGQRFVLKTYREWQQKNAFKPGP